MEVFCRDYRNSFGNRPPFHDAYQQAIKWSANGMHGTPPMTAALAMTVLAVTEEPIGAQHGVYARQNQLLGLPAETRGAAGVRGRRPSHVAAVERMAPGPRPLGGDANCGPSRPLVLSGLGTRSGAATLHGPPAHQGVVRVSWVQARRRLLRHGHAQAVGDLVLYRGSRGKRLRSLCDDAGAAAVLAELLPRELASWDGTLRGAGNRNVLSGDIGWNAFDGTFGIVVDVTAELAERADERDQVILEGPVFLEAADPEKLLSQGRTLRIGTLGVRAGGEPVYLLGENPRVAAWVQVRSAAPLARYQALVRDDRLEDAMEVLNWSRLETWGAFQARSLGGPGCRTSYSLATCRTAHKRWGCER